MNIKTLLLFISFFVCFHAASFAQNGMWTWLSGGQYTHDSLGSFGMLGVPSPTNHPPAEANCAHWIDKQGNLWIYGGSLFSFSDLWKYDPLTGQWTWVKGNAQIANPPRHNLRYVADSSNTPGARYNSPATWVDTTGNFWLLGGSNPTANILNDLWKYDPTTNMWTWITGDTVKFVPAVPGIKGIPDHANTPGSIQKIDASWTDSQNNLWFFGGQGFDSTGSPGNLNDVWKYSIATNQWTWISGNCKKNILPTYGTLHQTDSFNNPGGRFGHCQWMDSLDNLWIMGGGRSMGVTSDTIYSDIWKYDTRINEWAWMGGSDTINRYMKYGTNCFFDLINNPGSRCYAPYAIDSLSRLWLFGGHCMYGSASETWIYDPYLLKWNRAFHGGNIFGGGDLGNYGTKGVPDINNLPPAREQAVGWWGKDNKLYLFGGVPYNYLVYTYSDLWVFNPEPDCNGVIGIQDYRSFNTVSLFPNPVTNKLQIQNNLVESFHLYIYNTFGELCRQGIINRPTPDMEIDVESLFPGFYFVRLTSKEKTWIGKFVKE